MELTEERIGAMADGLDDIANLADPVGEVIGSWTRPNGLKIEKVTGNPQTIKKCLFLYKHIILLYKNMKLLYKHIRFVIQKDRKLT